MEWDRFQYRCNTQHAVEVEYSANRMCFFFSVFICLYVGNILWVLLCLGVYIDEERGFI